VAAVDQRITDYAQLLVERSLGVQPGWEVVIRTTPLARPLVEEITRLLAQKKAYPLLRMNWTLFPSDDVWAAEAPLELLGEMADVDRYTCDHMHARITIDAPDNIRGAAELTPERRTLGKRAAAPLFRRTMSGEIPWVTCQFPTDALAQEAGMSLTQFEDFVYDACLRDWDEEAKAMEPLVARFDAASEVRIVGAETDLTLSLEGRRGEVDAGHANMPGGEFFFSPVEDSAEGTILFDLPSETGGVTVQNVRLTFRKGRVEEASAEQGEDMLLAALDIDDGARYLGELGIGCNTAITRPMHSVLYDEKMAGTVHLAVGRSYPSVGGTNVSDLHWDMIKDLRSGGRIELDGETVQENGTWLI